MNKSNLFNFLVQKHVTGNKIRETNELTLVSWQKNVSVTDKANSAIYWHIVELQPIARFVVPSALAMPTALEHCPLWTQKNKVFVALSSNL